MRARRSIAVLSGATLALTLTTVGVGAIRAANADGQTYTPAGTLTLSTGTPPAAAVDPNAQPGNANAQPGNANNNNGPGKPGGNKTGG